MNSFGKMKQQETIQKRFFLCWYKREFLFSPILTKQKMSMTILQFCSFCAKRKTDNHTIKEERVKIPHLSFLAAILCGEKLKQKEKE